MASGIPRSLLLEWRLAVVAGAATVGLCSPAVGPRAEAFRWGLAAAGALVYLLWELRRYLPQNHRPGEATTLPTLGAGTTLTLFRGLFTALLAGFLAVPPPAGWLAWAPGLLYAGVALADFFDGYAARVRNHATKLGEELDVRYDALGVLVAVSVLIHLGRLTWPFLLVGLLYYLFHEHMKLRARLGLPVLPLRPNAHRRMYAGFLFGYLAVALFPVFHPSWTLFAGYLFAAPVVAGFVVDWQAATGRIEVDAPSWRRLEARSLRALYRYIPAVLRLALLPIGALWLAAGLDLAGGWTELLAAIEWPAPMLFATGLGVAGLAALGMAAAGWLGRLAALLLIALVCVGAVLSGNPTAIDYALLAGSIGILLLGTGQGALWRPEDELLLRKAGSPRLPSRAEQAPA